MSLEPVVDARESEPLVDAWRDLLARYSKVSCALQQELHERHELGVSEFELLERLAESEQDKHRVQELGCAIHLSQSALSRLIGRLERDGLVLRAMCTEDRRGIFVGLTEKGRVRYEEARQTHRDVLKRTLFEVH